MQEDNVTDDDSCSAVGCNTRRKTHLNSLIKMFYFPRDPIRRDEWTIATRRKNWSPTDKSFLCSSHFITGKPSPSPQHPDYIPSLFIFSKKANNKKRVSPSGKSVQQKEENSPQPFTPKKRGKAVKTTARKNISDKQEKYCSGLLTGKSSSSNSNDKGCQFVFLGFQNLLLIMGLQSGNKVWKKDETAALIALYETERCLYDREHPGFRDIIKQKKAYERIHDVMLRIRPDCTVSEIKNKITSLQKQYSDELYNKNISVKSGSCSESMYKPIMWCFELLQFLDPHLPCKNSTKAIASPEKENGKDKVEENVGDISDFIRNSHTVNLQMDSTETSDQDTASSGFEDKAEKRNSVKRRKLISSSTSPLKVTPKTSEALDPIDREDIFGQYVSSEMKGLKENPLLYLQTKQTILEILTSANFELLNPE